MTRIRHKSIVHRARPWALAMVCVASAASLFAGPPDAEHETREFEVSVDGTPRGKCVMHIRRRRDGAETVSINAGLAFNYLVYNYRYSSAGTETWKDGRLVSLENSSNFNGKEYKVEAAAESKRLRLTVNGKSSHAEPDVWSTSYWRVPAHVEQRLKKIESGIVQAPGKDPERKHEPLSITLLNSDKGEPLAGRLQHIGHEEIKAAGQRLKCARYRISGGAQVELWYDGTGRLVRQESLDSGHKTVLELKRTTQAAATANR